jgi:hypothetical protein
MPCVLSRWLASSAWVQLARDRRGIPLGLAGLEGVEATAEVGVEPPLDGAGGDAEVGGDVLALAAPVGQPDDLESEEEVDRAGKFPSDEALMGGRRTRLLGLSLLCPLGFQPTAKPTAFQAVYGSACFYVTYIIYMLYNKFIMSNMPKYLRKTSIWTFKCTF